MSNIILQPSSNIDAQRHFADTIENSVNIEQIKPFVNDDDYRNLQEIYPSGYCHVWGVTSGSRGINVSKWNNIKKGDITLFSKSGGIFASAVTTYKLHNPSLSSNLWAFNDKGETWEYVYFLDEIKNHNIPYIDFNKAVGYSKKFVIQGFSVLDKEKSLSVLRAFDLESEIFIKEITDKEYNQLISQLEALEDTEAEITTRRRLEQGFLKQHLFGRNVIGTCACCHNLLPVSYLVTAHIKKRTFCNFQERRDINVVMPMCKLGCDELFEKGYLSVQNGRFVNLNKTPTSEYLNFVISEVDGNECKNFNEKTKKYFKWHFNHHKL